MDDLHKPHHDFHDGHISDIYQHSRIEEPPMSLDSAVLTHARQAIEKTTRKPFWKRISWFIPVSSTAMILITVSLVMQTTQQYKAVLPDASTMQKSLPATDTFNEKEAGSHTIEKKSMALPKNKAFIREGTTDNMEPLITVQSSVQPEKTQLEQATSVPAPRKAMSDTRHTPYKQRAKSLVSESPNSLKIEHSLKQIRKLIQQKDFLKAKDYLIALRKAHPDFMIPDDIRENLK